MKTFGKATLAAVSVLAGIAAAGAAPIQHNGAQARVAPYRDQTRSYPHRDGYTRPAYHRGGHTRFGFYFGVPLYGPAYYPYPYYYPYYPRYYYYPPVMEGPPVYIEQGSPQPVPAPGAPSEGWWYYCPESGAYYPYVKECRNGWQRVAPRPPAG